MTDFMHSFDLYAPASVEEAAELLDKHGKDAWVVAGGKDSFDWFKDRIKKPQAVIDISGLKQLHGIKDRGDHVSIGAVTTLTEIEESKLLKDNFPILVEAAGKVASPQIRNAGTLGGNVSQDTRCAYYRDGFPCYRAGGNTCYADTPEGMNREHCLFGASRCVAVTPSDTAAAVVALDAEMVIRGPAGERVVPAGEFFIGPAVNITRMTVVEASELLVAVRIPSKWAGADFYFEKVADRNTWDFPLVNVASSMIVNNGVVEDIRIVCSGVECVPKRIEGAEQIVIGSAPDAETADLAGGTASRGATPLNYNHFKIPLMENLVKRAIRGNV